MTLMYIYSMVYIYVYGIIYIFRKTSLTSMDDGYTPDKNFTWTVQKVIVIDDKLLKP